jgi:hypothetical protein
MKAGLRAHLDSLLAENKKVTMKDIQRNPEAYKKFIEDCKTLHRPIPPGKAIQQAGHHWLHSLPHLTGSADAGDWVVAQWSPSELRWYHSNDVSTMAKPLYGDGAMTHWEWVAEVPLPPL